MIRDFLPEDYARIKEMHDASGADYEFPDLLMRKMDGTVIRHPLFVAAKVLEHSGKIRQFMGGRLEMEMYFVADKSPWAKPDVKMACIQDLNKSVLYEAWLKGIDDVVCYVPPNMKRFVKRVVNYLGYKPPREGWTALSARTKETK